MGVEKQILKPGNGVDVPKKHDEVSMEYTGNTALLPVTRPAVSQSVQVGSTTKRRQTSKATSEHPPLPIAAQ